MMEMVYVEIINYMKEKRGLPGIFFFRTLEDKNQPRLQNSDKNLNHNILNNGLFVRIYILVSMLYILERSQQIERGYSRGYIYISLGL